MLKEQQTVLLDGEDPTTIKVIAANIYQALNCVVRHSAKHFSPLSPLILATNKVDTSVSLILHIRKRE